MNKVIKLEAGGIYYIRKADQSVGDSLSKIKVSYVGNGIIKFHYADIYNGFDTYQYPSSQRILPIDEITVFSVEEK